ncbi:uncharacterized protein DSM5745_02710 [Aspergillus mulundensis]|uniref:ribonuclease H n=1 Tax=Aspergillus mulundensis TaxID=1810919 RepID=A0A3D8SJW3_9EURO|nr:hypothetical protein DSM5745_02710 [Aspergillus mulundensis]RDW86068.1 hypothetical protein DSM5745_02710 [Aspergillus mulundensis]
MVAGHFGFIHSSSAGGRFHPRRFNPALRGHGATSHYDHSTPGRSTPSPPNRTQAMANHRFLVHEHYPINFTDEDIECPEGQFVHLACPASIRKCAHCNNHEHHPGEIVIAFDGACSNNGKGEAIASYGVYLGRENPINKSVTLRGDRHTLQVAELAGCLNAMRMAVAVKMTSPLRDVLRTVTIKSHSSYVVDGLTEHLRGWKEKGWKTAKGSPVANIDHWKRLEQQIEFLEAGGVTVRFWLVPKEMNQQAEILAKLAQPE